MTEKPPTNGVLDNLFGVWIHAASIDWDSSLEQADTARKSLFEDSTSLLCHQIWNEGTYQEHPFGVPNGLPYTTSGSPDRTP